MVKDAVVGNLIDSRYLLRREIARGGMGAVFEAEHAETGRIVALKLVRRRSRFARVSEEQLLVEAQAIAAIQHPGIVELLDVGVCDAFGPYIALEMLVGRTLDGIIAARRKLPVRDVVSLGRQMCAALEVIHARGVLHRDIKPSNVFVALVGGAEVVKLFDFGIAALENARIESLSGTRESCGTPEYMAPEQVLGEGTVGQRADLYSVGVTLYECLTGEVPHGGSVAQVALKLAQGVEAPPVRALRPEVDAELEEVIAGALALDPESRFATARAMGRALVGASSDESGPTHLLVEEASSMVGEVERVGRQPDASIGSFPRVQRLFERVPYITLVDVLLGDEKVDGRSEDISLGGMLVRSAVSLPSDAAVKVRFALPGRDATVVVPSTVRWSREGRHGDHAIGIQFVELTNECRKAILDFVRKPEAATESPASP